MVTRLLRIREPPHFYTGELPALLEMAVKLKASGSFAILDLGCGDGAKLFALRQRGLLENAETIVGVDFDPLRIARLKQSEWKNLTALVSDACDVKGLQSKFDVVLCSALIEHVPDDRRLLKEIKRLLADDGVVFLRTTLKRKYGFWLYRRNGVFVLAPEHVRDYPSIEALFALIDSEGLQVAEYKITPMGWVSIGDALLFVLHNFGLVDVAKVKPNAGFWRVMKLIKTPIKPYGFSLIDMILRSK
jgi:SAM-dependent methyltransferase